MDPHQFIAEVYRRMALRTADASRLPPTQKRIDEVANVLLFSICRTHVPV